MPVERVTATGTILRLVEGPAPPEQDYRAPAREALKAIGEELEKGDVEDVCLLGLGDAGFVMHSSFQKLGELALARDQLSAFITDALHGDAEDYDEDGG